MLPIDESDWPSLCEDCGHSFNGHSARHSIAKSNKQIEGWMECSSADCQCMLAFTVDPNSGAFTAYPCSQHSLEFDLHLARTLTGKLVIVDIAYYDALGNHLENRQLFGTVLRVTRQDGLVIAEEGGELKLPPLLDRFSPAEPGTYALDNRGVVVENPSFIASWGARLPEIGA